MINGELFLLLPEDDELLQSLKLGLAFKRLVVMKAKEVCLNLWPIAAIYFNTCDSNYTVKRLS